MGMRSGRPTGHALGRPLVGKKPAAAAEKSSLHAFKIPASSPSRGASGLPVAGSLTANVAARSAFLGNPTAPASIAALDAVMAGASGTRKLADDQEDLPADPLAK
jgi:hypothetical protein